MSRRRIMLTSFGYRDRGGRTIVPRALAGELAARGWDVTVFHAAVAPLANARPTPFAAGTRMACA